MSLLLDTNALVWSLFEPERLGPTVQRIIEQDGTVLASKVSGIEIAIKRRLRKIELTPTMLAEQVERAAFLELDIEYRHLTVFAELDLPHRDPFDLLLIAQARSDDLTLVTSDRRLLGLVGNSIDALA